MLITKKETHLAIAAIVLLGAYMLVQSGLPSSVTGLATVEQAPKWSVGTEYTISQGGSLVLNLKSAWGGVEGYYYQASATSGLNAIVSGDTLTVIPWNRASKNEQVTVKAIKGGTVAEQALNIRVLTEGIDTVAPPPQINQPQPVPQQPAPAPTAQPQASQVKNTQQDLISKSRSFAKDEEVRTSANVNVGKKTQDDPGFEVRFTKIEKAADFRLEFFHDSQSAQPVKIEGISSYALSRPSPAPYELVTLIVPLVSGKVPTFQLKVGSATEVFSFGEQAFEPQIVFTPEVTNQAVCTTITTSDTYNLTSNVLDQRTCFNITVSNVEINCNGFTIAYDGGATTSLSNGVRTVGNNIVNVTVRNCIIRDNTIAGSTGIGINFTNTNGGFIINNTITTNSSSSNGYGIFFRNSSFNVIENNTIRTSGASLDFGIFLNTSSTFNNITGNSINASGTANANHGVRIEGGSHNNRFDRNNITATGTAANPGSYGVFIVNSNSSLFNNTILSSPIRWINTTAFTFSNFTNTTFIALPNGSIRFPNLFNINGSFDISRLRLNATSNPHRAFVNVTNLTFLNVSAQIVFMNMSFGDPRPVVDLDDDGFFEACNSPRCVEDFYNSTARLFSFNVSSFSTYSVQDDAGCSIISTSVNLTTSITGGTTCIIIAADNVDYNCNGNTITFGSNGGSNVDGFRMSGLTRKNITIRNCIIRDNNTGGAFGVGINFTATNSSFIINNTIQTNGTNNNYGILVRNASSFNVIANNTVRTRGSSSGNAGILINISSVGNNVTGNTILADGTASTHGLRIESSSNDNRFNDNNIMTQGTSSYGIFIINSNSSVFNRTMLANVTQWINITPFTFSNFTNITFATGNGSIAIAGNFSINGSDLNQVNLNVTFNRAFLNANNFSMLNQSANIILVNLLGFTDPFPIVDFEDDGSFITCSAPQCVERNFTNGQFVFDVTSFTTYGSQDTACGTISASTTLTTNISSADTCITFGASNIVLDCNGNTISYNSDGGNDEFGITATSRDGITIKNCIIKDVNSGGSGGIAIRFDNVRNATILNNSIQTNGTTNNHGVYIQGTSTNNGIVNNTIRAKGNSDVVATESNAVNFFGASGTTANNTIRGNVLNVTQSTGSAVSDSAFFTLASDGHLVINNTLVFDKGSKGAEVGVSDNVSVIGNLIVGNGSSVSFTSSSNDAVIEDNVILQGPFAGFAIEVSGDSAEVNRNDITFNMSSSTAAIQMSPGTANAMRDNRIRLRVPSGTSVTGISNGGTSSLILRNLITNMSGAEGTIIGITTGTDTNTIANNTIVIYNGSSTVSHKGIVLSGAASSNSVAGNLINTSNIGIEIGLSASASMVSNVISGNTIRSVGPGVSDNYGIHVRAGHGTSITGNVIFTNGTSANVGIKYLPDVDVENVTISNNNITTAGTSISNAGIRLVGNSFGNIKATTLAGNTISTHGTFGNHGIFVDESSGTDNNNTVSSNDITVRGPSGDNFGVLIGGGSGNIVSANVFRGVDMTAGVVITPSGLATALTDNVIQNHRWDLGRTAGIDIDTETRGSVINNTINGSTYGIRLVDTVQMTIRNNTMFGTTVAMYLDNADNNTYYGNNATSNGRGFQLVSGSNINNITQNWVISSTTAGIDIASSTNNVIYDNFVNNTNNVDDSSSGNFWNVTYQCDAFGPIVVNFVGGPVVGGNFWSNYAGLDNGLGTAAPHNTTYDGDLIGDTQLAYNDSATISSGGDMSPYILPPNGSLNFAWMLGIENITTDPLVAVSTGQLYTDALASKRLIDFVSVEAFAEKNKEKKCFLGSCALTLIIGIVFFAAGVPLVGEALIIDALFLARNTVSGAACGKIQLHKDGLFVTERALPEFSCGGSQLFSNQYGTTKLFEAFDIEFFEPLGVVIDRINFTRTSGNDLFGTQVRYRQWTRLLDRCRNIDPLQNATFMGNVSNFTTIIPAGSQIRIRNNNPKVLTYFGSATAFTTVKTSDQNAGVFACTDFNQNGICDFSALDQNCGRYTSPIDPFAGRLFAQGSVNSSIFNNQFYCNNQSILYRNNASALNKRYLQIHSVLFEDFNVDATNLVIQASSKKLAVASSVVTGRNQPANFTHFLFNANNGNGMFICPAATQLSEVNGSCTGFVNFSGPFPQTLTVNGSSVTVVFDGTDYIFNLSGSGAGLNNFTCGDPITSSMNLTQDFNASGTCFTIAADNVRLNCGGKRILGDGTGNGIEALSIRNVTIENCIIERFSNNILLSVVNGSLIRNNTLINATISGLFIGDSTNSTVPNNTFAGGLIGVRIGDSGNITMSGNFIENATIGMLADELEFSVVADTTINRGALGAYIIDSFQSNYTNTRFSANNASFAISDTYNFTINGTFAPPKFIFENSSQEGGIIAFNSAINLTNETNITFGVVRILKNFTFVNSSASPNFNATASLTFRNVTFTNPRPLVAFVEGIFQACNPPQCVSLSFNRTSGEVNYNVSSFTTYSTQEAPVECGVTLFGNTTMNQSLRGNSTCFTIGANDIFLDCNGTRIEFNANGGNNDAGVVSYGRTGVTVRNCIIVDVNAAGAFGVGINFTFTNSSFLLNNTIFTNGTNDNYGISLASNSFSNFLANNTISTNGSAGGSSGIRIQDSSNGTAAIASTISTVGDAGYGVFILNSRDALFTNTLLVNATEWLSSDSSSRGNNFTNTTFATNNGSIRIFDAFSLNFTQNLTRARLNVSSNRAFLNATNLTFLNTTAQITLNGVSFTDPRPTVDLEDDGTFVFCSTPRCTEVSFANNVFVYNVTSFTAYSSEESQVNFVNITVTKTDSPDPVISGNLLNYSIVINNTGTFAAFNVSLVDTYPAQGAFNSSEPAPVGGTNNTFVFANISASSYVQINISFLVLSVSSGNISNGALINNTVNVSFINSTGGNTSVRANISTTVQVPVTRIGASPGVTPNVFECGAISSNTVLGADVTSAGSCFNINADSVSLDCNGHTITYGTGGLDASFGVYSIGRTGITVRNCIIQKLTNSGSYGISIYFVNVTGSIVQNNTLLPRGTFNNYAVYMETSDTTRLFNNTIATAGVTSGAFGYGNLGMNLFGTIFGSDSNNITDNFINTSGQDHNWGIYINASTGNIVRNNTISTMGTSLRNFGVHFRTAPSNFILKNVIFTNGTDASGSQWYSSTDWGGSGSGTGMNPAIRLDFDSDSNVIANNSILSGGRTTTGSATRNYGIYLVQGPSSNSITDNIIRTNGTNGENHGVRLHLSGTTGTIIENNNIRTTGDGSSNYGVDISTSADGTTVRGNVINTSGVGTNLGIHIFTASSALVENNQIFTSGTGSNNIGLYTDTSATSNTFNNNTIKTSGTTDNYGIQFAENTIPGSNIAENNTINASGSDGANHGIRFGVGSNDVYSDVAKGNRIVTSGPGGFSNHGVLFSRGFRSLVISNIIQAGGLGTNRGVSVELTSSDNVIANNTIRAGGTSSSNLGVFTDTPSTRNNITGNNITTNGTNSNYGIQIFDSEFVRVRDNTIFTTGSGASNHGILIVSVGGSSDGAFGNIITGNLINTNGSGTSSGIRLDGQISTRFVSNTVVANNTVFTNGTGATNIGIYLVAAASGAVFDNNLTNNTIVTNGTSDNAGIRIDTTTNTRVINNTIRTGGSSTGNDGLFLSSSSFTVAVDNTIQTSGSSSSHAIRLSGSGGNNFTSNNISTSGTSSYGVAVTSPSGNLFNNTLFSNPVQWISSNSGSQDNFTNTTFATVNGSIRIFDTFGVNQTQDVNRARLNVSFNRAFLNATNLTFLNTTAQIILNGITSTVPVPTVDLEDDGTFVQCSAPRCVNVSFVGGVFTFNVTSFTTYSTQEAPAVCGQTLTSNTTLTQSVTGNDTCFTIGADNIFLDCDGFTIFYDQNGTGADGVVAVDRRNVTVRNCIIIDVNASGAGGIGVNFTRTNSSLILNNTIQTNGTTENHGILLRNANRNTVVNNTVRTNGTTFNNFGIYLFTTAVGNVVTGNNISTFGSSGNAGIRLEGSVHNSSVTANTVFTNGTDCCNNGIYLVGTVTDNNVTGNTVRTDGSGSNVGIDLGGPTTNNNRIIANKIFTAIAARGSGNDGIKLEGTTTSNNITGNNITTNGTSGNRGIRLEFSSFSIVESNRISTGGSSGDNFGVHLFDDNSNNNFTANIISTSGTSGNHGIMLESLEDAPVQENNRFVSNNISTAGNLSYSIFIIASNSSIFLNTLLSDPVQWLNASENTFNNFTNTTFLTANGSIRIPGLFNLNGSQDVNRSRLNISSNRAFLNATNLTFLNTTAQIVFNNIVPANQSTIVAFNDITFAACNFPQCQNVSFVNGIFVFNVSSFTVYSTNGAPQPPFLRSPPNNSFITNRTPLFVWDNSTDLENDVRQYTLQVARNITFTDTVINISFINETGPVNTSFPFPVVLDVDRTYYWRVSANDSFSTSNYSQVFNFTIQSFIALSLQNALVNFSNVTRGVRVETNSSGGPPLPFVVQNDGNIHVNVTVTGRRLFVQAAFPSTAYQYNVSVNETNSFKVALSQTNFTNMTNVSTAVDVRDLNWTDSSDGNDTAAVHIAITAPLDEPGGNFTSNVTFTASIG